jgi:membrane fusion protein (multidrug efflux system)
MLADASQRPAHSSTAVFYDSNAAADADVKKIIAANAGRALAGDSTATRTARAGRPSAVAAGPASVAAR